MALRSGRLAASIGVGTVTIKKSEAWNASASLVKLNEGDFRSEASTSRVRSSPALNSPMRVWSISKPTTGVPARANAAATGKPT